MLQLDKGFTIIEVLISALIITVAIVGLVMGFTGGLNKVGQLRETSIADRLIQEKMEELRGGFREIPSPTSPDVLDDGRYEVTITAVQAEPSLTALTKVTVTVEWLSHIGKQLSRSLVTYFTEKGITKTLD